FHMPPAHRGDVHSFPTRRSSDLFADLAGLFFAVPDRGYGEFFTFFSNVGLQRLAQAGFIVGDEMRSGRENVGSRAVVAFELDDFRAGKVLFEAQDVVDLSAAPAIDRLVVVAHHADIGGRLAVAALGEKT